MPTHVSTRSIVRAFHRARSSGSLDEATSFLAGDFVFESPLMRFENRGEYLASHRAFQGLVTGFDMISELVGRFEATWIYDLKTATPVDTQRTAEHFRLKAGKISAIFLLFDASPWIPLMSSLR